MTAAHIRRRGCSRTGFPAASPLARRLILAALSYALMVACAPAVQAAHWVQVGDDDNLGVPDCVDSDSIRQASNGYTYFRLAICSEPDLAFNDLRVRCPPRRFSDGRIEAFVYGPKRAWKQGIFSSDKATALAARYACRAQ